MELTPKQIAEILAKKPEKRYNYFIRTVAELEEVWGLMDNEDGWLMLEDDEDKSASDVIAIFPNREFADLFCEKGGFNDEFKVEPIDLYEFMEWMDDFEEDGVKLGVFPTPDFQCAVMSPDRVLDDLNREMEKEEGEE
jgi:hypothetical protein